MKHNTNAKRFSFLRISVTGEEIAIIFGSMGAVDDGSSA
jgi:hypothetical protein